MTDLEAIAIGTLILLFVAITILYFHHLKTQKNEISQKNKKVKKLLRFQRGNKTLTPEQQELLNKINKRNLYILKSDWKNEHL